MGSLIFKLSLITLLVGFLLFLAYDDYRSRKQREAEDREKEAALPPPDREDSVDTDGQDSHPDR